MQLEISAELPARGGLFGSPEGWLITLAQRPNYARELALIAFLSAERARIAIR